MGTLLKIKFKNFKYIKYFSRIDTTIYNVSYKIEKSKRFSGFLLLMMIEWGKNLKSIKVMIYIISRYIG